MLISNNTPSDELEFNYSYISPRINKLQLKTQIMAKLHISATWVRHQENHGGLEPSNYGPSNTFFYTVGYFILYIWYMSIHLVPKFFTVATLWSAGSLHKILWSEIVKWSGSINIYQNFVLFFQIFKWHLEFYHNIY